MDSANSYVLLPILVLLASSSGALRPTSSLAAEKLSALPNFHVRPGARTASPRRLTSGPTGPRGRRMDSAGLLRVFAEPHLISELFALPTRPGARTASPRRLTSGPTGPRGRRMDSTNSYDPRLISQLLGGTPARLLARRLRSSPRSLTFTFVWERGLPARVG